MILNALIFAVTIFLRLVAAIYGLFCWATAVFAVFPIVVFTFYAVELVIAGQPWIIPAVIAGLSTLAMMGGCIIGREQWRFAWHGDALTGRDNFPF